MRTIVRVDQLRLPEGDSVAVPPVYDHVAHTGNGVAIGCHTVGSATGFIDPTVLEAAGARARTAVLGG